MEHHLTVADAFGASVSPSAHLTAVPLSVVVGQPQQQQLQHQHQQHQRPGVGGKSGVLGSPHHHTSYVEMYDPDFHHVISVAPEKILHTPHPSLGVSRLVLCRNFVAGSPASSCTKGDTCKFVHADILGAKKHPIHVNYAWRSWDLVTYPRLPAGETLVVFAPNERPPADDVPSESVLITRGSLMRKEHTGPLSHCAHYYFNRMCNRGERCNFIHAIIVDPNATDLQRAPAPTTVAPLVRGPVNKKNCATSGVAPLQPGSPMSGGFIQQHVGSPGAMGYQLGPSAGAPPPSHMQQTIPPNSNAYLTQQQSYVHPQQLHASNVAPGSGSGAGATYLVLNPSQIVPTGPQSFTPPPPGAHVYYVQQQPAGGVGGQPQSSTLYAPPSTWQQGAVSPPQPQLQPLPPVGAPSMTSLFSSQVGAAPPAAMLQPLPTQHGTVSPGHSVGGLSQVNNPMEWSMIGGLYNTGSMSASMSLSNSHSGATIVLQKMMSEM